MSKAKERALEAYPEKLVTYSDLFGEETLDDNGLKRSIYLQGYEQAIEDFTNNFWHDPDEAPEIGHEIIWENEHFHGKRLGTEEWKAKVDCFGRKERWCYLADILPSTKKADRPYSVVDFSNGYDEGYRKAVENAKDWISGQAATYVNVTRPGGIETISIDVNFVEDFEEAMEEQL